MISQERLPLRRLMWLRIKRNRLAVIGGAFLLLLHVTVVLAPFLSPYLPRTRFPDHPYLPPRKIHWRDTDGRWRAPFVYRVTQEVDMETFQRTFVEDRDQPPTPVRLLVRGDEYELLGFIPWDRHLIGIDSPDVHGPLFLLGGDKFGRDLLVRLLFGGRISLTIGLCGVAIVLVIGLLLGGLSGLLGGIVDDIVQRLIEFIRSIPTLFLWVGLAWLLMAVAAALPGDMRQELRYVSIAAVVSPVGWTSLARTYAGNFRSPDNMGNVLAHLTLAVPGMILAETALSFLGLGLRSPTISWGVLLVDAQQLVEIAVHPWILWPAVMVVLTVLAFNFVGDGLRDAADPYAGMEGAS